MHDSLALFMRAITEVGAELEVALDSFVEAAAYEGMNPEDIIILKEGIKVA